MCGAVGWDGQAVAERARGQGCQSSFLIFLPYSLHPRDRPVRRLLCRTRGQGVLQGVPSGCRMSIVADSLYACYAQIWPGLMGIWKLCYILSINQTSSTSWWDTLHKSGLQFIQVDLMTLSTGAIASWCRGHLFCNMVGSENCKS